MWFMGAPWCHGTSPGIYWDCRVGERAFRHATATLGMQIMPNDITWPTSRGLLEPCRNPGSG